MVWGEDQGPSPTPVSSNHLQVQKAGWPLGKGLVTGCHGHCGPSLQLSRGGAPRPVRMEQDVGILPQQVRLGRRGVSVSCRWWGSCQALGTRPRQTHTQDTELPVQWGPDQSSGAGLPVAPLAGDFKHKCLPQTARDLSLCSPDSATRGPLFSWEQTFHAGAPDRGSCPWREGPSGNRSGTFL